MFEYWPENRMWSYQLVRALVAAHFGGGDMGEMLDAASRMDPTDVLTWHTEWLRLAEETAKLAENAEATVARSAWRRASTYYRLSAFYLAPDDPQELDLYRQAVKAFGLGVPELEPVRIPFEGRSMHGYVALPKSGQGPHPTLILMGGLESMAEEVYFAIGVAAVEQGYACLLIDGPGQGGTMREEQLYSRFAYEEPIAAAIDYIENRPELDAERVGMIAYSLGGYYVSRAAAFEPRLRTCIVWGAEYDYAEVWQARSDDHLLAPRLCHTLGTTTMGEARKVLQDFNLRDVANRITCPTLVVHGEEDFQVPMSHATRTYDDLPGVKDLVAFAAGEPGSIHCQWDAPHRVHQVMFDWMKTYL